VRHGKGNRTVQSSVPYARGTAPFTAERQSEKLSDAQLELLEASRQHCRVEAESLREPLRVTATAAESQRKPGKARRH
jgi:hypothetical protein